MIRARLSVCLAVLLAGCPTPPTPDGGQMMMTVDASVELDAGVDAGRPVRDAGLPDSGFTSAPLGTWCELRALAECTRDVRCGRLSDAGFAGCMTSRTFIDVCDSVGLSRGVGDRRIQYVEAAAVRCINDLASGSCEETPLACGAAFTGLTPPDGGCLGAIDCSAAAFCDVYDNRCPHRCTAWTALGDGCDGFFRRCDPSSAACDEVDAGLAVCVQKKDAGAPCSRFDGCGDGLACTGNTCQVRVTGPGQACAVTNGFPVCPQEFFCRQAPPDGGVRPPGTCERKAGLGGTCTGPGSCLPSLRCSTLITTGVCLTKAALHTGCISYDDCEDGLFCDAHTQQCERLPVDGGDCSFETSGYRCAPGHTCSFAAQDVCEAWKAIGAACSYSQQCLSNDCEYSTLPDGGFGGRCIESCSQRADGGL